MGLGRGGITQSGRSGSYAYSAIAGREDMPVNNVTFYDALRFANWLHNGQPTGAQDASTTEGGAYTITAQGIMDDSITRNAGATIFLVSEDEWYKAAYYDALSSGYFYYPAGSDTQTTCATPGATPNTANCKWAVAGLTEVGSYTGSASPEGTFDQGGNVFEWNEALLSGSYRGIRGGSFDYSPDTLAASYRGGDVPHNGYSDIGFRVAMIPEPSTALLLATGLAGLAAAGRWRPLH
jgi:formylglycine-generating enzyme required for sulfatase activity